MSATDSVKRSWGGARAGAGRPRAQVNPEEVHRLRREGLSKRAISARLGVNVRVISRVLSETMTAES